MSVAADRGWVERVEELVGKGAVRWWGSDTGNREQ